MDNGVPRQSSIKDKLRSSMCCFTGMVHHERLDNDMDYNKFNVSTAPTSPNTTSPTGISSWLRKSSRLSSSEYGGIDHMPRVRGRSLRARMGQRLHQHSQHRHHCMSQSADFSYDPSSYALNFEDEDHDEHPFKNFSSRLPASPPPLSTTLEYSDDLSVPTVQKEIVGYS